MANHESRYFTLDLESLRALGGWAGDCAERVLSIYEALADSDSRPRAAIEGIREFAGGGKRTAGLRSLAVAANAAAREIGDPAAAAAARAAGAAAASAYTHPLSDVHQTKHVVGPAAYAALALELDGDGGQTAADGEVRWAIQHAPSEARDILLQMPARQAGKGRFDTLLYELDSGIRARTLPQDGTGGPLDLRIRPATLEDTADLQRFAAKLFSEGLPGIFRRPVPTLDEEAAFIRSRIEPANSTMLVAAIDGSVVGLLDFLGGSLGEEMHAGTFAISVDRDHRGQGIGSALIQELVRWAPSQGITRIQAWVWMSNPRALVLYERLGFEREGLCRRALMVDGRPVDVVLVARLLIA